MSNKVNVLTSEDVKFKPWRWWSNWVDVAVFVSAGANLLQMRISRTNEKQFKVARFSSKNGITVYPQGVGDLTQMKGGAA